MSLGEMPAASGFTRRQVCQKESGRTLFKISVSGETRIKTSAPFQTLCRFLGRSFTKPFFTLRVVVVILILF